MNTETSMANNRREIFIGEPLQRCLDRTDAKLTTFVNMMADRYDRLCDPAQHHNDPEWGKLLQVVRLIVDTYGHMLTADQIETLADPIARIVVDPSFNGEGDHLPSLYHQIPYALKLALVVQAEGMAS